MSASLSVKGLIVHYGRRVAVDGLDLELVGGEIVGLLGPNGAGKSTALAAVAGAVMPSAGTIVVGGVDLAEGQVDDAAVVQTPRQPQEVGALAAAVDGGVDGRASLGIPADLVERVGPPQV